MMDFVLILAIGLVAGTLSGIVGFGSSIMLMDGLMLVSGVTLLSASFL